MNNPTTRPSQNKPAGGGGGGGGKRARPNNRNQRKKSAPSSNDDDQTTTSTGASAEPEVPAELVDNNNVGTEDVGSAQEDTSSSSNDSGGTAIFNTADEGEPEEQQQQHHLSGVFSQSGNTTLQEISSDEEGYDAEESPSVVNASLIVNLSNANVSAVEEVEERRTVISPRGKVVVLKETAKGEDNHGDDDEHTERVGISNNVNQRKPPVVETEKSLTPEEEEATRSSVVEMPANSKNLNNENREVVDEGIDEEEDESLADSEVEKLMAMGPENIPQGVVDGLPNTVTVLTASNGVVVYLVGTAHFSQQSQLDVVNTIQQTRPTLVLLELCSSRRNILSLDEETVLKEVSEMSFQKIRLALSNSGTVQGTLHLLLLSMSAQLTKKLGMAPGGEFRAAVNTARNIPGCVILLGDRPFNITISRALAALTFTQKVKLAWQFLTSNEDITREEIEKCKEKDLLERMLTEMTGEFPSITEVFVNERDVYLAHSLYLAATSDAHRSNGGPIVGVVGMGHVPGIVRNWGTTKDDDVVRLVKIPKTPLSTVIMRKAFKLGVYALIGVCVFKGVRKIAARSGIDTSQMFRPGMQAIKDIVALRSF